jgi:hypothetical protein
VARPGARPERRGTLGHADYPSPPNAGRAGGFPATALDPSGNLATGSPATAHFSSSDGSAALPANARFPAAGTGGHPFVHALIRRRQGMRTITVSDPLASALTATARSNVGCTRPCRRRWGGWRPRG